MVYLIVLLAIILVLVAGIAIATRRKAVDPAAWHVDPMTASDTGKPNWYRLVPEDAQVDRDQKRDGQPPTFTASASAVGAAFDAVAKADARVEVLAGSAADGFVTYMQRSAIFGFPDFISVRFIDLPAGGSTLAIYSRARDGQGDMGVNEKRVKRWVAETTAALA